MLSGRLFSALAQSMPLLSSSTVTRGGDGSTVRAGGLGPMADGVKLLEAIVIVSAEGGPIGPPAIARYPCDAISVRKVLNLLPMYVQDPFPQSRIGIFVAPSAFKSTGQAPAYLPAVLPNTLP